MMTQTLPTGKTWEETPMGTTFHTLARTITEVDLVNFVSSCGFVEPLFLDAEHAAEGGYERRLVPGTLTMCYAEGLVMQTGVISGTGLALLHIDFDAKKPVYVGDTITVSVEVTESRASKDPGRGIVTTRNTVTNQSGEIVLQYTPIRMIRGRDFIPA
jgi:acyl dehydratase